MKNHLDSLNEKQKEAVLQKEGPVLILAGAGSGKTKTITHRIYHLIESGADPESILAVTFTNKAAKEMRERVEKMIRENLSGRNEADGLPLLTTFHSLGVRIVKENAKRFGLTRHFSIFDRNDSARVIKEVLIGQNLDPKRFEPAKILSAISGQKGNYVTREEYEAEAGEEYYPRIIASVWKGYEETLLKEKALDFDDLILLPARFLDKDKEAREHYQKIWRHIHIDEYQDTNACQYVMARRLSEKHRNICVVGDIDQCLPKGTKVAVANGESKPLEKIKKGDLVLSNYGSGDIRPAKVTRTRKRLFSGSLTAITTKTGGKIMSTPNHMHFAGYRHKISPQLHFAYLMHKKDFGFRLGVSQMYTSGQRRPVIGFEQRCNQEHADASWVVATFDTPNEARVFEYTLSLKYQIPTLPFVARKGPSKNGYVHDQEIINRVFKSIDTANSAKKLLSDFGLFENYPHHRAQSRNSSRKNIVVALCGDRRGKTPMHRISMVGNDKRGKNILKKIGLSVRPAKKNSKSWRFETSRRDYGEILSVADKIQRAMAGANIIKTARLGGNKANMRDGNSLPFLPASSIRPGMAMFSSDNGYEIVEKVKKLPNRKTNVYDLDIENTHNFSANGITTHNSIYTWRGANIKNILNFEKDYPEAKVIVMEENYRSTETILRAANAVIEKNTLRRPKNLYTKNEGGEKIRLLSGMDENDEAANVAGKAGELIRGGTNPDEIAVLYRANFQSRVMEEAFLSRNIPYQILGTRFFERKEVKDALSYIRAALNPESLSDIKRIINVPARSLGKVSILKIFSGQAGSLPEKAGAQYQNFLSVLEDIKRVVGEKAPSEAVREAIKRSGLLELYGGESDEDKEHLSNIKELATLAKKYDGMPPPEGVEKLLEDASLASDQDELQRPKKGVKLMTVHASKGLEFDHVFVTGLEEGLFPQRKDTATLEESEEERRLFYVALTRGRKKVFLSWASCRTIFGSRSVNTPSEFIADIDAGLMEEDFYAGESAGKVIYLDDI